MDRIMARVLLSLTPLDGDACAPEPLLSAWLLDYVWDELVAVQEGIAEICRWFEPLLDYWRFLHPRDHVMNDWSQVMICNIEKDSRIERKKVSMDVCCLIWRFRDTLVLSLHNQATAAINAMPERPNDKEKLLKSLAEGDMVDVQALLDLMSKKRHKASRDMSEEAVIPGTMAIHVTAWDWNAAKIKNLRRDQTPFVQAIILERKITATLVESARKFQTVGDDGKLITLQKWTWWDELVLPGTAVDAHTMKSSMQGTDIKVGQRRVRQLLFLEEQDKLAINKMVAYVASMPCAKASAAKASSLSQDVVDGLTKLLEAIELNSSRLRIRAVDKNPTSIFHKSQIKNLGITLPDGLKDEYMSDTHSVTEDGTDGLVKSCADRSLLLINCLHRHLSMILLLNFQRRQLRHCLPFLMMTWMILRMFPTFLVHLQQMTVSVVPPL
ncbi:hypothetical protein BDR03DRAFT_545681 [Suillus americanus]|nr:hypothetical protein BDR03DRAFT_545681 [Suillus americanus]